MGEFCNRLKQTKDSLLSLKAAIRAGLNSGEAEMFDPVQHLEVLKVARRNR